MATCVDRWQQRLASSTCCQQSRCQKCHQGGIGFGNREDSAAEITPETSPEPENAASPSSAKDTAPSTSQIAQQVVDLSASEVEVNGYTEVGIVLQGT